MKKKDLTLKSPKSLKKVTKVSSKKTPVKKKVTKKVKKVVAEPKPKKVRPKKPYYVDPVIFSAEIVASYETEIVTDSLADCVLKIATRLSYAPNFINYSYRDEMVGDAIVKMLYAIKNKKFDPTKGNAFSYFTRIAFNAFCNRIKKEKKEKEFILNLQESVYDDMMNSGFAGQRNHVEEEAY